MTTVIRPKGGGSEAIATTSIESLEGARIGQARLVVVVKGQSSLPQGTALCRSSLCCIKSIHSLSDNERPRRKSLESTNMLTDRHVYAYIDTSSQLLA